MKHQSLGALGTGKGAQVCDSATYISLGASPAMSEE